jgi:hypothetical protein
MSFLRAGGGKNLVAARIWRRQNKGLSLRFPPALRGCAKPTRLSEELVLPPLERNPESQEPVFPKRSCPNNKLKRNADST